MIILWITGIIQGIVALITMKMSIQSNNRRCTRLKSTNSFFLVLYSRSFEWTSTHGLTALTNYTSYLNYFKLQTLENMLLLKAGKLSCAMFFLFC